MFNLVVLIDLKKAFDTVDHQILLSKLELYGIKGQALNLLKSYLTNRKQKCQIKNVFSSERLINCGVPQGSILGPLLFLLYINDLPHCLSKTKPRLFADDTNLTASANSVTDLEAAVNSDLENLRKWLIANKLSLNVAKTEFIIIGSKSMTKNISNPHPNVFIENKQIKQVYAVLLYYLLNNWSLRVWESGMDLTKSQFVSPTIINAIFSRSHLHKKRSNSLKASLLQLGGLYFLLI